MGSSLEKRFHEFAFGFEMVFAADRHKRVLVSLILALGRTYNFVSTVTRGSGGRGGDSASGDGFNKNRRGRERAGGGYGSHGGFGGLRRLQEEKGVRICCAR